MIIGNFVTGNPFGYFMEYACDWFLIHRSEQEMLSLAPDDVPEDHRWVETEPSGVNLFLCIKRPELPAITERAEGRRRQLQEVE